MCQLFENYKYISALSDERIIGLYCMVVSGSIPDNCPETGDYSSMVEHHTVNVAVTPFFGENAKRPCLKINV